MVRIVLFGLVAICLLGCNKSNAKSKTSEAALNYKATVDGIRNVFDSQGIGGLGTFRDAWGRKLVSVDAGQFGLMKSLGLNPNDNEDDILIDYSSSHLTIRYDFEGEHFEYGEEWD